MSAFGQKIKLNPDEKTHEETIMKLLMSLDEAAKSINKRVIFFIDEFQQIATLDESHSLEARARRRPTIDQWTNEIGRLQLKLISTAYLEKN